MQIHVNRNGEKLGPYTPEEVRSRLATGQLSGNDLGWFEGVADWIPLADLVARLPAGAHFQPAVKIRSGLASASFVIAIIASTMWAVCFTFIMVYTAKLVALKHQPNSTLPPSGYENILIIVGLAVVLGAILNLVGLILGLTTITRPVANKWMAVTGVVINAIELAGVALLFVIGAAR